MPEIYTFDQRNKTLKTMRSEKRTNKISGKKVKAKQNISKRKGVISMSNSVEGDGDNEKLYGH